MDNCRQQTAEGHEVTNPGHSSKEKQSKQEIRTRGNSGIQSYNPSDEHRRVDERSSRNNCFVNGPSVAQDCHQTGISQNTNSSKRPSNGRHSVADDRAAKQINQLQATSTKNHSYRHCPESTSCSTYGPVECHPRNPVGRKNDKVGPPGKGRGTNDECENSMGRNTAHINPDRLSTFQVRQYTSDPIRCYRRQKYGHTSRTCYQTSSTCDICAGKHSTAECIEKRKTVTIQPKCSNCKRAHTTASKACPVRRQTAQAI